MKKPYTEPEWDFFGFAFEKVLTGTDDLDELIISTKPEDSANDEIEV